MARTSTKRKAKTRQPKRKPKATRTLRAPAKNPLASKTGPAAAKAGTTGALSICVLSPHPFVLDNLRALLDRPKFTVQAEHVEFLPGQGDRKSTRLNSSHPSISDAVFC